MHFLLNYVIIRTILHLYSPEIAMRLIMPPIETKLVSLFRKTRVMNMQTLQHQLINKSQRSIFRYLISEDYYSSYTHSGKYYTLKNIPSFNAEGLWFYGGIGFSKHGSLKPTLVFLVNNSKAGKTHDELKKELHIRVHNTLLELIRLGKLTRSKFHNKYVYVNAEKGVGEQQLAKRQLLAVTGSKLKLPSELTQIKILIEIIKNGKIKIDSLTIMKKLKVCGEKLTFSEVKNVLLFYGLKKN